MIYKYKNTGVPFSLHYYILNLYLCPDDYSTEQISHFILKIYLNK